MGIISPSKPPPQAVSPFSLYAVALGWLIGCGVQLQQARLWESHWYITGIVLIVLLVVLLVMLLGSGTLLVSRLRATKPTYILVALTTFVLGFSTTGLRATWFDSNKLNPMYESTDINMQVRIVDLPRWRSNDGKKAQDVQLTARVEHATLNGEPVNGEPIALPRTIRLSWYGKFTKQTSKKPPSDLRIGQLWQLTARLKAPHGNANPHGFDYELWLWQQGIGATGYVRNGKKSPQPKLLSSPKWWQQPMAQWRQSQRDAIQNKLGLAGSGGVVAALLTGDQAAIDSTHWQLYRDTGTAHLMSISGLHITMFAWIAILVLGKLWRLSHQLCIRMPAQHAGLLGGLLLAALYAWFSGMGVPAQRTVCMLGMVVTLRLLGKDWPWHLTWLLVAAMVVAFDPWALLQPGFWLSFVAVGVLIAHGKLLSPVEQQRNQTNNVLDAGTDTTLPKAKHSFAGSWLFKAGSYLWSIVREQAVITLALAPLTLLLFKQTSLVALVANLVAVPLVTLFITPLTMLGVLWAECWTVAAWLVAQMDVALQYMMQLPHAVLYMAVRPWGLYLLAIAGALLLVLRTPLWLRLFSVPLMAGLFLWQPERVPEGELQVTFLDVGQGSAVHVQTHTHHLVFDTGVRWSASSSAGSRIIVPYLRAVGATLDTIVVSHDDGDHSGGFDALAKAYPNAMAIASYPLTEQSTHCTADEAWEWDSILFKWLHPTTEHHNAPNLSDNDRSCVLHIGQQKEPYHAVLLTGDITKRMESQLVETALEADEHAIDLEATVLQLAHHGSHSSSSRDMLWAVSPDLAISQSGYRNSFGHPSIKTRSRLQRMDIPHLDTQLCGAITWKSWEPYSPICYRTQYQRYWHHKPTLKPLKAPNK